MSHSSANQMQLQTVYEDSCRSVSGHYILGKVISYSAEAAT